MASPRIKLVQTYSRVQVQQQRMQDSTIRYLLFLPVWVSPQADLEC